MCLNGHMESSIDGSVLTPSPEETAPPVTDVCTPTGMEVGPGGVMEKSLCSAL